MGLLRLLFYKCPLCRLFISLDLQFLCSLITIHLHTGLNGACGLSTSYCLLLFTASFYSSTTQDGERGYLVSLLYTATQTLYNYLFVALVQSLIYLCFSLLFNSKTCILQLYHRDVFGECYCSICLCTYWTRCWIWVLVSLELIPFT